MDIKLYVNIMCLVIGILITISTAKAQGTILSNQSIPIQLDSTTHLTQSNDIFVLVPTGVNPTDFRMNETSFNLFKLDTDILFKNKSETTDNSDLEPEEQQDESDVRKRLASDLNGGRESRKLPFVRGLWSKPKVSPLYLINGTVCRFVNAMPICTTLSTSGLLPTSGGQVSRPIASVQSGGSSVQFANQQPRPSAIMDDSLQDYNVENQQTNATNSSMALRGQQQFQPVRQITSLPIIQGARRPLNPFAMNRRPLNLMPFRRPVRQVQIIRGRTNEVAAETRTTNAEGSGNNSTSVVDTLIHSLDNILEY